ncbi:hypothetical protein pb186bvf_016684 [Paramecium bursaria]
MDYLIQIILFQISHVTAFEWNYDLILLDGTKNINHQFKQQIQCIN